MLYVTDLTGYLYCKRKLYLTKILGHKEPLSKQALVGSIKHKVLENIHNSEERVIKSLDHIPAKKDLHSLFILTDSSIAHSVISENLDRLSHFSIDYAQLMDELGKMIEDEAKIQAEKVMKDIISNNAVGQELIDKMYPKIRTETTLESKEIGLRGKIDKIEFHKDSIIPIEIKTGAPGRGSPWQDHITQLTAYCILLEKEHSRSVNKGAIIYYNPRVVYEVSINPFMVDEVHSLIREVNSTLSNQVLPDILKNQNKCNICGLKDICHNIK